MPAKNNRAIHITESDYEKAKQQLSFFYCFMPVENKAFKNLIIFDKALDRATIVPNKAIPAGIVMINSQVTLEEMKTGLETTFMVALPTPGECMGKKISIFSPLGCAIIGRRIGDVIECETPHGFNTFVITKIDNRADKIAAGHVTG